MKKLPALVIIIFLMSACRPTPPPTPRSTLPAPEATATPIAITLVGQPLKGSQSAVYRLMENGRLRHIYDWPTYLALGYRPEEVVEVTDEQLTPYPLDLPLTRWLTGQADSGLYLLQQGQRYRAPNPETMEALGGNLLTVSYVDDDFLHSFELAPEALSPASLSTDDQAHPRPTAVVWANGHLWTANQTGLLTRWDTGLKQYQQYRLPDESTITALAGDGQNLYLGTNNGEVWRMADDGPPRQIGGSRDGWVSAIAVGPAEVWYAEINHYDRAAQRYRLGRGLVRLAADQAEVVYRLGTDDEAAHDPLRNITALVLDPATHTLWAATRFAGLVRYNLKTETWQVDNTFTSDVTDNEINDLELGPDGSLWLATRFGVGRHLHGSLENYRLAEGATERGALSLAIGADRTTWVAGDNYIAWQKPGQAWQVYSALDQPLLNEQFNFVALDEAGHPWFMGRKLKIHFDGQKWTAYDVDVRRFAEFEPGQPLPGAVSPPLDFPSPTEDYPGWLNTWPRPVADNGRGIHFLQTHWFDEIETQQQINRMQKLGMRWTLVVYANRYQLMRSAPMFKKAGIMVVWRPFIRPYEDYAHWREDVEFLRAQGIPPYFQLYNEPSLAQEWDEDHPLDREVFLQHLLPAIRQVYEAGGYVGLQFLDPAWLRVTLQRLKTEQMTGVFDRLFFVPHPYGLNHPPEYDEDINGVLGFGEFARVFEEEIGFGPIMIAGEGGWRPGEAQDARYPMIDESLHRDYHLAVFGWFRTGQLSNGAPLPDYFFAFCPWLISDPHDPAAWFDSSSGDRTLTIRAVEAMPDFERKFGGDE
ncbi:MAG: hypothetical protein JXM69_01030 [Anaerolineae bacterium]|nr:hypothetical protein [Anaerolineae bacterium]